MSVCPECGQDFSEGRPTPGAALGLHRYRAHGVRSQTPAGGKRSTARGRTKSNTRPRPRAVLSPEPDFEATPLFESPEEPPVIPKKRRFWLDWFTPHERIPGEIRPAKVGRPRKERRTSFATGGTFAWMGLAELAKSTGQIPVSRALQIQSGIAGEVLDNAVAGTRLDRMVQPFIGDTQRFRDLGMLALFPFLVMICDAQPNNTMAAAGLELVVRQQLHMLAEGVKRMKAEDRKLADTVETLTGIGMDLGENPVHTILSMIFAPVEPSAASSTAPAPAAAAPEPDRTQSPPVPPPPSGTEPEWNGFIPTSEPLPFNALIVTPSDIPPGL